MLGLEIFVFITREILTLAEEGVKWRRPSFSGQTALQARPHCAPVWNPRQREVSFSEVVHSEKSGNQDLIHLSVLAKHVLTFWQPALHIVEVETGEMVEDFPTRARTLIILKISLYSCCVISVAFGGSGSSQSYVNENIPVGACCLLPCLWSRTSDLMGGA